MGYEPKLTITPKLLGLVESIAAVRDRIQAAAVEVAWIPDLQKEALRVIEWVNLGSQ